MLRHVKGERRGESRKDLKEGMESYAEKRTEIEKGKQQIPLRLVRVKRKREEGRGQKNLEV